LIPRGRPALIVVAALAFALAGCTSGAATVSIPADATGSTVPVTTATPAASGSGAAASPSTSPVPAPTFPLSLTDDSGSTVTLAAKPARIISLTPGATEILFALGAGDRVVGVSQVSDYPPAAAKLAGDPKTAVAKFDSIDIEKVVGLAPDLIFAGGGGFNPAKDIAKLRSLGLAVLVLDAQGTHGVDGVLKDIDLVGQAVGASGAAATLASSMRDQLDAISKAAVPTGTAPTVFYETGYDPTSGSIYGVADYSFVAGMIRLAGGNPILTGDPNNWAEPLEKLLAANPDVIVIGDAAYGSTADSLAARPGWGALTAVKKHILRPVSDIEITRPGPRLPTGLRNLALAINPAASLPAAP
jgi:iron complex transport system substrate-binding protein